MKIEYSVEHNRYLVPLSPEGNETVSSGVGPENTELLGKLVAVSEHWLETANMGVFHEVLKFNDLAARWKEESRRLSTATAAAMLPAYQRIIGMGSRAVPYLLRELEREPDHWFWALKAITNEDPVADEDRGDVEKMRQAWLAWGKQHSYLR